VSWSSILGIWLIQQYPNLYHAFVSSGQMVNTTENDQLGYQLALDYSRQRGNQRTVAKLQDNGPPPYRGPNPVFRYLDYLDVLNDYMGSPPVCAGGATDPILRTGVRTGGQGESHPRTD
jgi:hypothetical protein